MAIIIITNLKRVWSIWAKERTSLIGAALSFYIILAITPLLAVIIGITGLIFEQAAVQSLIIQQLSQITSKEAVDAISYLLQNIKGFTSRDIITSAITVLIMLWGATNVFIQMQNALNIIFKALPNGKRTGLVTLERYVLSLFMLVGLGALILLSVVAETTITSFGDILRNILPDELYVTVWRTLKFVVAFTIVALLFAAIYKILPNARVRWADALKGALFAALLYAVGLLAVGMYFGSNILGSAYGAATSLIIILLSVYLAAQIFLLGAIYAKVSGDSYKESNGILEV
jgi:membrane protein